MMRICFVLSMVVICSGAIFAQKGWNIERHDLTNSNYYPFPSNRLIQGSHFSLKYTIPGSRAKTGDIDGDNRLEIVTSGDGYLNVYKGDGSLKWSRPIWGNLNILADVNGDSTPEIITNAKYGSIGRLECYSGVASSDPVKLFVTSINQDYGEVIARGTVDFNGDGICELLAIKSTAWTNPRGVLLFDIVSSNQLWYHDMGPHINYLAAGNLLPLPLGDEIIYGTAGLSNGVFGMDGTNDFSSYLFLLYSSNSSYNGWRLRFEAGGYFDTSSGIVDINKDNQLDIIATSYSHGPGFWDGIRGRIYAIIPHTREVISGYSKTFIDFYGNENPVWLGGFADLDKNGSMDILINKKRDDIGWGYGGVVSLESSIGFPAQQELQIQDCLLEIQFINDINGDSYPEIGLLAIPENGMDYRFLLINHNLEVLTEIYVGQPFTAIVSDVNSDGLNDLLLSTDTLTHIFEMTSDKNENVPGIYADFRSMSIYSKDIKIEMGPLTDYNTSQGWEHYSHRMRMPGASYIKGTFYLDNVSSDMVLSVCHLTSLTLLPNDEIYGYAPIDIKVNGTLLVDNFDVAEHHQGSYSMEKDEFIIPQSLLNSEQNNTIIIEYDASAYTHYWIQEIKLDVPDSCYISFSSDAYNVKEYAGSQKVSILRVGNSDTDMSISYEFQDVTAKNGPDYIGLSGKVNFKKGQVHGFIEIPIINETASEGIESFDIRLSDPTNGGRLGAICSTRISIIDDDASVPVFYVNASASSGGDGSTWALAFRDLQAALEAAEYSMQAYCEIWVAKGTYTPASFTGTRLASYKMINQVSILGGFKGDELKEEQRNPTLYKTILSGDIKRNDLAVFSNYDDNCYHVVTAYGVNATAVLDGFVITGGHSADSYVNDATGGGGLFIKSASPTISNCVISRNYASDGGGVFNYQFSNPRFVNCSFVQNKVGNDLTTGGGAVSNWSSNPVFINCIFYSNSSSRSGGAFYNWSSSPCLIHCVVSSNYSSRGGAFFNVNGVWETSPEIIGSIVGYNLAEEGSELALAYDTRVSCSYTNLQREEEALYWFRTNQIELYFSHIYDFPFIMGTDLHLKASSPFIDLIPRDIEYDIDNESRTLLTHADLGADEFIDSDEDNIPDWWEQLYFSNSTSALPFQDPDKDGLNNLDEYELYHSHPLKDPIYVNMMAQGSLETGTLTDPFLTIQKAIDYADDGDTVLLAPGTYKGSNNLNLNFHGKSLVLFGSQGPLNTTIDCEKAGRGFVFQSNETSAAVISGLTIKNGFAEIGGAFYCENASPQIHNCIFENNSSADNGNDIYSIRSTITIANSLFVSNKPNGIYVNKGNIIVTGIVTLASANITGYDIMLLGDGVVNMDDNSYFDIHNGRIRCNIHGSGTIYNNLSSELIIEDNSHVNLSGSEANGKILCDGLLRVRGNAIIENCDIIVTRASFEDSTIISNSIITAEAGSPYGQFFVEESVVISNNHIHADGDRYMDLDPKVFDGVIANNLIFVTITEGKNSDRGGLLELRGKPGLVSSSCTSDEYLCQIDPDTLPVFSQESWTIEELVVTKDAKINLTNRFDFGNGDTDEVLYVKKIVLEDGAILNTAFNKIYYEQMTCSPTATINNIPLLGFSLKNISFDDHTEYSTRIRTNNMENLILTERIIDNEIDPSGIMRMTNKIVQEVGSPIAGQTIHARAKGHFARASENNITVEFKYKFVSNPNNSAELIIYLSDSPLIGDRSLEIARIRPPLPGRPGAINSNTFSTFKGTFQKRNLNFVRGTFIELELKGEQNSECIINDLDPQVYCVDYCRDYDGYGYVDLFDYLILVSEYGLRDPGHSEKGCLDLCLDNMVNINDIRRWNLKDTLNACASNLFIPSDFSPSYMTTMYTNDSNNAPAYIISAKPSGHFDSIPNNSLFTFNNYNILVNSKSYSSDGRLIKDSQGTLYQIDCNAGISCIENGNIILDPNDNINLGNAVVSIGMNNLNGIPISDAVFSPSDPNIIYVVPVLVAPMNNLPYKAAAKLNLTGNGHYSIMQLYGINPQNDPDQKCSPSDVNDISYFIYEPDLQHQTEIEIDDNGNIFILSTCEINRNNWIIVYNEYEGDIPKMIHFIDDPNIIGPVEMVVSPMHDNLCLSCSSFPSNDPNILEAIVYKYSILYKDTEVIGLLPDTPISIICPYPELCDVIPQYCQSTYGYTSAITSMSLDETGNQLYITGFTMPILDNTFRFGDFSINTFFNTSYVAVADIEQSDPVFASPINHQKVALPISIIPISSSNLTYCDKIDINGSGIVDIDDLLILATQWVQAPGNPSADVWPIPNGDNYVDFRDFELLAHFWLKDCTSE